VVRRFLAHLRVRVPIDDLAQHAAGARLWQFVQSVHCLDTNTVIGVFGDDRLEQLFDPIEHG
jgi:hypothetical protein